MKALTMVLWLVLVVAAVGLAATPQLVNYQGRLTTSAGQAVADGTYLMRFRIYDGPAGGTLLWDNGFRGVQVTGGLFSYQLGDSTALAPSLFATDTIRWLGITVGSDAEMTPRVRLTSTTYGYKALQSDTAAFASQVADNVVTSVKIVDGSISFSDIGDNGAASGQVMKWDGSSWQASDDATGGASGWQDNGAVVSLQTASDAVGIGTESPEEKLDVAGNIHATGTLKSGSSITVDGASNQITSTSGKIGFGDDSLQTSSAVLIGSGFGDEKTSLYINRDVNTTDIVSAATVRIENLGESWTHGIRAIASAPNLTNETKWVYGFYGEAYSPERRIGVAGSASHTEGGGGSGGRAIGVSGDANDGEFSTGVLGQGSAQRRASGGEFYAMADDSAYGVMAEAEVSDYTPGTGKHTYGLYGQARGGDTAIGLYVTAFDAAKSWAALLDGDVKVAGRLGIGLNNPTEPLDIAGNLRTTGFKMPTGAATGRVLTSDATGTASWQAAGNNAGWTDDGTVVRLSTSTDRVGIGTSGPSEQLEITGNFALPASTASAGIVKVAGVPFIHEYGTYNTFIGRNAGNQAMTGTYNSAIGEAALQSNSSGTNNTASGFYALNKNSAGDYNTAIGSMVLWSNTTGEFNTACGQSALYKNTSGGWNTATGTNALYNNTTGVNNTAAGHNALWANTTGWENTANGLAALLNNTAGYNNTAVGYLALHSNTTGANNTAIGYQANVSAGGLQNATAIGANAVVNAPNKIRLGDVNVTVIEGQVAYTWPSDRNQKENFQPVDGSDVLEKIGYLNISSWNYKGHDPKLFRHYGPMAQDFFAAFGTDGVGQIGDSVTLNSGDLAGITLAAVKELNAKVKEIDELRAQLRELQRQLTVLRETSQLNGEK